MSRVALLYLTAPVVLGVSFPLIAAEPAKYSFYHKALHREITFAVNVDEVMIRFREDASSEQIARFADGASLAAVDARRPARGKLAFYRLSQAGRSEEFVAALRTDPAVERVLPGLMRDGQPIHLDPGRLSVRFDPVSSPTEHAAIVKGLGSRIIHQHQTYGFYTVAVPADRDLFETIQDFVTVPSVLTADPVYSGLDARPGTHVPADYYFGWQWSLLNTGSNPQGFGTPDADTDFAEVATSAALDLERGDTSTVIVVLDTGVDLDHPDLIDNVLPRNGEDWYFENPEDFPPEDPVCVRSDGCREATYDNTMPNFAHGTLVAGVAAATEDGCSPCPQDSIAGMVGM